MDKNQQEEFIKTLFQMRPLSTASIEAAKANFEIYDAHVRAGFSPQQALQILCAMMAEVVRQAAKQNREE